MTEIRNLIRNGETFYPQTHVEGVLDPDGNYIGHYEENSEWVRVITDSDGKFLEGIKTDGTKYFYNDIENQSSIISSIDNSEWLKVIVDKDNYFLAGIKRDGKVYAQFDTTLFENICDEKLRKAFGEGDTTLIIDTLNEVLSYLSDIPTIFKNKRVSILGDSISTFEGYIIDGYPTWYPNGDVQNVEDTWWKKIIDATESTLEVNASYSGSTAISATAGFLPRVKLLGNPDIIIIELGTNDSYRGDDNIGVIDYDTDNPDLTKFAPAYIAGIKEIKKLYPTKEIICMIFMMSDSYADTIKEIATHYEIKYLDVRKEAVVVHPQKAEMDNISYKVIHSVNSLAIKLTSLEEKAGYYDISDKYLSVETDKEGKTLGGRKTDGTAFENIGIEVGGNILFSGDDDEKIEVITDSEDRILSYRDKNGTLHEGSVQFNHLDLSDEGMTDFQKALKNAGLCPGDISENEIIALPEPEHYGMLNLIIPNLPTLNTVEGYAEYYDYFGNYFKLHCSLELQGQTSKIFAYTGGKGNYTLDLEKDVKFGSWVPQDSFHLKGCAKDITRSMLATSYKFAYTIQEALDAKPNRVLIDDSAVNTIMASGNRMTDWPSDARCLPDGFSCELYVNGEYWGLYSWQLKKHRKNYSMDKKDYTSFFIDADAIMTDDYQNGIWNDGPDNWWTGFDIKGPKDLICMDGSEFDGDNPKELIDSTSEYYDDSNKKHKGSAQTKALIKSFSTRYLEVKELIIQDNIEVAKQKFNEYFDYNACMYVYIFNCLMMNSDSVKKNTLWAIYNGGKIAPMLWDLDGMYGEGWIGLGAYPPSNSVFGIYDNAEWPLALFATLYEQEIKDAYASLRNSGIINIDSWKKIFYGRWINRIGEEAYKRDYNRWPETPSYRENQTDTEYWKEGGKISGTMGFPVWDENTEYRNGDGVVLPMYPENPNHIIYTYINDQPIIGKCPVKSFYHTFPQIGGYWNSPKRMEKWMQEQLRICDTVLGYNN